LTRTLVPLPGTYSIEITSPRRNGAKLPVTQVVAGYYDEVSKSGGSRFDTSSLITRL